MIKYELKCGDCGMQFEGWFVDSAGYESQAAANEIECPSCGQSNISKAIMAPNIARRRGNEETGESGQETRLAVREALREMRREVEDNCENVGANFPEEARKIHYEESEARGIYGEASLDEARELNEEGIEVQPLPILPEEHN